MNSSITKRWVRGSLFFTLALVLVAEGVFLYFIITGYYHDVSRLMENQFADLRSQLVQGQGSSADDRFMRLIQTVENFAGKAKFELMLVNINGGIEATSSGVLPGEGEQMPDIAAALQAGGNGVGQYVGRTATGERVMAATMLLPAYPARDVVAMRLVTSLSLVDKTIRNIVIASVSIFCVIILASVLSGLYFIRSIVYPLQKVEATAAKIAQGDFETRIDSFSSDEIGSLCKTINHMAQELSNSERMKNDFISSVSHELRTPLTSIKGWTETIAGLSEPADPNLRKGIEIIAGEAHRLYDMVEELLDFSRMQGGISLHRELLDLAAEVEDAALLSGQRAAALGVALNCQLPHLPVPVMADKNRLRQVILNVLDNAIKYSYTGGQVGITILQEGGAATVVVKDNGPGIAPDDLENVKIKFYKGKGAMRGSGIGLAVAEEIMLAHGAVLSISSQQGKGTQVSLSFSLYLHYPARKYSISKTGDLNAKTSQKRQI